VLGKASLPAVWLHRSISGDSDGFFFFENEKEKVTSTENMVAGDPLCEVLMCVMTARRMNALMDALLCEHIGR
jgi:hypothetical protein